MAPPSIATPVLQTLSAQQAEQLKQRICEILSYIVRTNSNMTYFRDAPLLARYHTEMQFDSVPMQDTSTPEVDPNTFTRNVPLSTYKDYRPYISLLAPELPVFIATSSGTSGSLAKYFPKYARPEKRIVTSTVAAIPEVHGPTKCTVFSLRYTHTLNVLGVAQRVVKAIPFSLASAGILRGYEGWEIENDTELVKTRISGHVTPIAVAFVKPYHTFLLLHTLFAMGEQSLTTFNTIFITVFSDLVRLIKTNWEDLAPWLKRIWPDLTLVAGNATGSFSAVLPQVRNYVGPSVSVQCVAYASSEAWVGTVYNPESGDNLYKAQTTDDVLEYLNIEQPEKRRNVVMRVSGEFVSEAELHRAIRWFPRRYGFLLELESELRPGLCVHTAPRRLQEYLSSINSTFARFSSDSKVGEPSVRVLAAGTFSRYRSWRIGISGGGGGQIKVPTVIYDPEVRDWLVERVVEELGDGPQKVM
ncbi:GH3 auxin-responsive promoter-domain-containing protein [Infundibulicybe gibba]|nr:GH3 auxin-responsive promoter-domain-containing protein [Infundibulicybe gibba]